MAEYEVDDILGHRYTGRGRYLYFYIRWAPTNNNTSHDDSWVYYGDLKCDDLLKEYKQTLHKTTIARMDSWIENYVLSKFGNVTLEEGSEEDSGDDSKENKQPMHLPAIPNQSLFSTNVFTTLTNFIGRISPKRKIEDESADIKLNKRTRRESDDLEGSYSASSASSASSSSSAGSAGSASSASSAGSAGSAGSATTQHIIYMRVSTKEQDSKESHSLNMQQNICEEYVKSIIPPSGCYILKKEVVSAQDFTKQTELCSIFENIQQNTTIYIYAVDRLSRDLRVLNRLINLANVKHIDIYSVSEKISFAKNKIEFLHLLNKSYDDNRLRSDRSKETHQYIKKNGGHIGKAPFGYIKVRKDKIPTLEINKDEMSIIKQIKSLHKDKISAANIANIMSTVSIRNKNITKSTVNTIINRKPIR
jgi:DNA invertase Pin-like site-specific DNA recombinase